MVKLTQVWSPGSKTSQPRIIPRLVVSPPSILPQAGGRLAQVMLVVSKLIIHFGLRTGLPLLESYPLVTRETPEYYFWSASQAEMADQPLFYAYSVTSFWQHADSGPNPGDQDIWNGDLAGLQRYVIGSYCG